MYYIPNINETEINNIWILWEVSNMQVYSSHMSFHSAFLNPDCVKSELTGASVNIPSPFQHICVSLQTQPA